MDTLCCSLYRFDVGYIGKLNVHANTLAKSRQVVKFIYGHTWVLSLMRTFTKNHELVQQ